MNNGNILLEAFFPVVQTEFNNIFKKNLKHIPLNIYSVTRRLKVSGKVGNIFFTGLALCLNKNENIE